MFGIQKMLSAFADNELVNFSLDNAENSSLPAQIESRNASVDMQIIAEILQSFYDDFHNQRNYVLIGLYVPVFIFALVANILVIFIIFKYRYMRRLVEIFYLYFVKIIFFHLEK